MEIENGSKVELSPPFGVFTGDTSKDAVLISGGIGVTSMVALQQQLGSKVKKIIHVDKNIKRHAFKEQMEEGVWKNKCY